ncbi:chemotaxis protein CheW, partial [Duganella sp. FT94W]
ERGGGAGDGADFALFHAGATLMALRAAHIQEALPFARVQRTVGTGARVGMLDVPLAGGRQQVVWVFDLALLVSGAATIVGDHSQVMLVRHGDALVGLLVDELHSVQPFAAADLSASPLVAGEAALAPRLIQANQGALLIQEIDVERLFARLRT